MSKKILSKTPYMQARTSACKLKIVSKPVVVNGEVRGAVEDSTTIRKKQEVADNNVDYILDDFVPLFQLELKDDLGKFY